MASRRYSFEAGESPLHPDEHDRLNANFERHNYQDSPVKIMTHSTSNYSSVSPPDSPIPASPTASFQRSTQSRHAHLDDSPPPPPPHRIDPASSQQNSVIRKPVMASGWHPDQTRQLSAAQFGQDPYSQDTPADSAPSMQPPGLLSANHTSRSRGTSPHIYPQRPTSRFPEPHSFSSTGPLIGGSATPSSMTPSTHDIRSSRYSSRSLPLSQYSSHSQRQRASYQHGSPYYNTSLDFDPTVSNTSIDPNNILDDGDDGFIPDPRRRSALGMNRSRNMAPAAMPNAGAGTMGAAVFDASRDNGHKHQNVTSTYGPISDDMEKRAWRSKQEDKQKRKRCMIGVGIVVVIVLAVAGGIIGGIFGAKKASGGKGDSSVNNAAQDSATNGDLDINSPQIQALMNNQNLHKVFPAMDYTAWGVQYPLCLTYNPSQNNVTRDMAVISQLTNTVRLYGTDCNQTEMVLHAIDRLKLTDMKIWLGVWVDLANQTTTDRQMNQMYHLLSNVIKDHSIIKGVIIGNEVIFRATDKATALTSMNEILRNTKANFTANGYTLPVGTSDLGDNWDATLAANSDYIMANIHPFFAGVQADVAASWTWNFWQQHDVPLTAATPSKEQIIAEVGWPSGGGTDCGGVDGSCSPGQSGSVASVDNMNVLMNDWVCQALTNQTTYFWFEAFDEAWKIQYNTPGREWEDKWGLMDSARNLKPGVKIPDCGGRTV